MAYPFEPGYVTGDQSSREAATSMQESAETLRTRIRNHIAASPEGKTCDEVEVELSLRHQTASARCSELKRFGQVSFKLDEDGKKLRRPTRSGRKADVLFVVDAI